MQYLFPFLGISKLERDRDTTSQDSGISQMSTGGNDNRPDPAVTGLEERMEELNIRQNFSVKTSLTNKHNSSSLPYTVNGISDTDTNGITIEDIKDNDVIKKMKEIDMEDVLENDKRVALAQLYLLITHKHMEPIKDNFKMLLRILLELLEKSESKIQQLVLAILTEIFKCKELKQCYIGFLDLLIIKVLNVHLDPNKEVS